MFPITIFLMSLVSLLPENYLDEEEPSLLAAAAAVDIRSGTFALTVVVRLEQVLEQLPHKKLQHSW